MNLGIENGTKTPALFYAQINRTVYFCKA